MTYHLSRKPISVVKSILYRTCNTSAANVSIQTNHSTINISDCTSWAPFDRTDHQALLGSLDLAFLFSYAVGMFASGHIAERLNLRYFLSGGMVLTGLFTCLFGVGYFKSIHSLSFYVSMQVFAGLFSATGWPSVVACMGSWYGKGNRGLIMGLWNSHTSFGNILGSVIAGLFVTNAWGLSFIVPGLIIGGLGILVFFFLVPEPRHVGCEEPDSDAVPEREPLLSSSSSSSDVDSEVDVHPLPKQESPDEAIGFIDALCIPGVIEFALCLFFAKLVSYTFLFWLPDYIHYTTSFDSERSADLSTAFDWGGILGGILAGVVSDVSGARACTCFIMLLAAAPMMFVYQTFGSAGLGMSIVLLILVGAFVNGPYALITTAVSADLGTHHSLNGNAKALATVTAIIDGTGSVGAALGPLLTGIISDYGWKDVFYMLICANIIAMILLVRLVHKEIQGLLRSRRQRAQLS
ncbi:hypothetical protein CAPTEDRAFT_151589 [Capitella teleta]|uniref:Sugar phosphate exchanger 3 n=1 Tax=Capitella teleta TaxID=283909 RepID=R7VCQ8_CAPTE|nr:hypothetical protein CAPTEDRAFT_151589 [Capitella teleta]|eukprot:ELU16613.1 hypothetical protein CAPTEDRAFT_151589 [Capitella teleta]